MTCKICGKSRAKYHDLELVIYHIFHGQKVARQFLKICKPFASLAMMGKSHLGQSEGLCQFIQ